MSDSDLLEKEDAAAEDSGAASPEEQSEKDSLGGDDQLGRGYTGSGASGEGGGAQFIQKSMKGLLSGGNKWMLAGIGGIVAIIVVLIILLFLAAALLKAMHFPTIIRSTGFAGSQFIMRGAFKDAAYDVWVDSGLPDGERAKLPDSSLLEKARGQDMQKIQRQLDTSGDFTYTRDAAGNVDGFKVKGEKTSFDEIAKKAGAEKWEDLSPREKMSASKYITDEVKFKLADTFDMETRGFRNGFWKGFREATGIRMTRFRDIVRDKFGSGEVNEKLNNDETRLTDEIKDVRGSPEVHSDLDTIDDAAEDVNKRIDADAAKGIRTRASEAFDGYLKSKGSSLEGFNGTMSKVSGGVFVATMYCMGHDLAGTSDRLNEQMEKQMARFGHQQQTTADQIRAKDVTSGDFDFASSEWSGSDDGKVEDASNSVLYQQDVGNPVEGDVDLSDAPRMNISLPWLDWLKPVDSTIKTLLVLGANKIPGIREIVDPAEDYLIDKACQTLMNPTGQFALLGVDLGLLFVSGGTSEEVLQAVAKGAAVFGGFYAGSKLVEWYINQVAGTGIVGNEQGEEKYTKSRVSTEYLDKQAERGTNFGAPQTTEEASQTGALARASLQKHYNSGSFSERYFAISNPYSLVGKTAAVMPTTPKGVMTATASAIGRIGSTLTQPMRLLGVIFGGPKAHAATERDLFAENDYFGINLWGWTQDELDKKEQTNMFDNAAQVEADIKKDPEYYEKLNACYDSQKLLSEVAKDDNCSRSNLKSPRALDWRIYKLDQFALDQISSEGLYE